MAPIAVKSAFILAAGLGTRMRPLTLSTPKPLIKVKGKALLDYALEAAETLKPDRIVVNVHYLADQIEAHLKARNNLCEIIVSDEREQLLDSGGGVIKALPFLTDRFAVLNADTFWRDEDGKTLVRLAHNATSDFHMLLASREQSLGFTGKGDFSNDNGRLMRRGSFIYAGAFISHQAAFTGNHPAKFSLNTLWDQAQLTGEQLQGRWFHIGDVKALEEANSDV